MIKQTLFNADTDKHWCDWCEASDRPDPIDHSVVTDCIFIGVTEPVMYLGPGFMHVHGATIVDPAELTIRAAIRRRFHADYPAFSRRFFKKAAS